MREPMYTCPKGHITVLRPQTLHVVMQGDDLTVEVQCSVCGQTVKFAVPIQYAHEEENRAM
jgi:rRNA maturation protein Nop10